ncbi:MAG: hypothetical protein Tsb0010_05090 [Parvularculaceae bacterium]
MTAKRILAGAVAVAALAGVTLHFKPAPNKGAPFIPPNEIAAALCIDQNLFAERRRLFLSAAMAYADDVAPGAADAYLAPETLGNIGRRISTDSAVAQSWFDHGFAQTADFNHDAAIDAFRRAQAADPGCAMCYWGEAYAWGPNINMPMAAESNAPALAAARNATARRSNAQSWERALIDAIARRYAPEGEGDRADLDAAFADAMDAAARTYADNDFVLAVAAEANMTTQAWAYWGADGATPVGRTARTLELLETVLARSPGYPPAIHLYIHAVEGSTNSYRARDYANVLASRAPDLGHLVHMPTHIYYRTGEWEASIANSIQAVKANEDFIAIGGASPLLEYGYYPHNLHFLLISAQMSGHAELALETATKLADSFPAEFDAFAAWVKLIEAAPYLAQAQFGDASMLDQLRAPQAGDGYLQAMWRYARGEMLAKSGDAAAAIAEIASTADLSYLDAEYYPSTDILKLAELMVLARAARADGDHEGAIEFLERAVAIERTLPVFDMPVWHYPPRQSLAAAVLQAGDPIRANHLFYETLVEAPNNAWALYGLAESFRAMGHRSGRRMAMKLFDEAWLGASRAKPELLEL